MTTETARVPPFPGPGEGFLMPATGPTRRAPR